MATRTPKGPLIELLSIANQGAGTVNGAWYGPFPVCGALFVVDYYNVAAAAGDTVEVRVQRTIDPSDTTATLSLADLLLFTQILGNDATPVANLTEEYNAATFALTLGATEQNRHNFTSNPGVLAAGSGPASNLGVIANGAPSNTANGMVHSFIRAQAVVVGGTADFDVTVTMVLSSLDTPVAAY